MLARKRCWKVSQFLRKSEYFRGWRIGWWRDTSTMSMLVDISFFHVAVPKSKATQQNSIRFSNRHIIKLFDGISLSSFLEVLHRFINKLIGFLDFNRNRICYLIGWSQLFFTRLETFTENGSSTVEFSKQTIDGLTLFWLILFVKVKYTFDSGWVAGQ